MPTTTTTPSHFELGLCMMPLEWGDAIRAGDYPSTYARPGAALCPNPLSPEKVRSLRFAQMCDDCIALGARNAQAYRC